MTVTETIRVLLVEDDEDDFILIRDMLADIPHPRFRLSWAVSYEAALASEKDQDIYLLDYHLGPHDGLEVLQALRDQGRAEPMILLTGQGDLAVDETAMRQGVADYLEKTALNAGLLARSIRYALERHRSLTELRQSQARFRAVFMGAGIGMALVDRKGRILEVNPALEEMLGRARRELSGCYFYDSAYQDEDIRAFRNAFTELAKGMTQRTQVEIRLSRRFSPPWWGRLALSVLDATPGADQFAAVMVEDDTVRRMAIESIARSEKDLRELSLKLMEAQEEERKLVAQELHDSVGSGLSALKYNLESLQIMAGSADPELQNGLEKAAKRLAENIQETRRICANLRPAVLDDLGILATIRWFTREFTESIGGVEIQGDIQVEETDVPEFLKVILYRLLQESLNNASRHAAARKILVALKKGGGHLEFSVTDDGRGFELEAAAPGMGLSSMKERTERSGGVFAVRSSPGRGTMVRAWWPEEEMEGRSVKGEG